MMVNHALLCKARGLVHIRHDDVADEWHTYVPLSSQPVECEPSIHSSINQLVRGVGGGGLGTLLCGTTKSNGK